LTRPSTFIPKRLNLSVDARNESGHDED